MTGLLPSVVVGVLAFAPTAPVYDPAHVLLVAPQQDQLPANAGIVVSSGKSSEPTAIVEVNGVGLGEQRWQFMPIADGDVRLYRMEFNGLNVGDEVVLQADVLHPDLGVVDDDVLLFEVVADDVTPPAFAEGRLRLSTSADHVVVSAPEASDDFGVAYYRFDDDTGRTLAYSETPTGRFDIPEDGEFCVHAVAVDIAGNEDVSREECRAPDAVACSHARVDADPVRGDAALVLLALLVFQRRRQRTP